MKKDEKRSKKRTHKKRPAFQIQFSPINYIMFFSGIIVIAIGFFLLSNNETTLSAILLVIGYTVILPLSIIFNKKGKNSEKNLQ